ncbi:MAG: hypothetical protein ACYCVZ_13880 [Streptosporangiaceae bacterium]
MRTRGDGEIAPPGWQADEPSVEEIVLAYLRDPGVSALPGPELLSPGGDLVSAAVIDGGQQPRPTETAPWRGLLRASVRQHRTGLIALAGYYGGCAVLILVTAVLLRARPLHLQISVLIVLLEAAPAVAGAVFGAPLVARQVETGATRLAWVQGAGRGRWLLGQAAPAGVVGLIGAAVTGGLAMWWWHGQPVAAPLFGGPGWLLFNLVAPAAIGWTAVAFALGVLLGVALRRTVPAMVATVAGYAALLYDVSSSWRMAYLPPLVMPGPRVTVSQGVGGVATHFGAGRGQFPPYILGARLGWPDGRPIGNATYAHGLTWLVAHHIRWWTSYQPGSRYLTFQLIEFGWLIALAAMLITAAIVLIRRRPA